MAMMLQSEKQHASQEHLSHWWQWRYNQRNNTHHRNIFHIDGNDATIRETTRITGTSFTSMAMMLQSEKQHPSQEHLSHRWQWRYNQRNNTHHRNIFHINGNDATIRKTTFITGTPYTSTAMMLQSVKQQASQKHLPHRQQWCYNQRNNTHHRNTFHIDGNDATIREITFITETPSTSTAMMLQSEKQHASQEHLSHRWQ